MVTIDVYEKEKEDALCAAQDAYERWYNDNFQLLFQQWVQYGNSPDDTLGLVTFAKEVWKDFICS